MLKQVNTDAIPESCSSPHTAPRKSLLASLPDMSIWHGKAQGEVILLGLEQSSQLTPYLCQFIWFWGCIHLHRRQEQVPCHGWTPYMCWGLETADAQKSILWGCFLSTWLISSGSAHIITTGMQFRSAQGRKKKIWENLAGAHSTPSSHSTLACQ